MTTAIARMLMANESFCNAVEDYLGWYDSSLLLSVLPAWAVSYFTSRWITGRCIRGNLGLLVECRTFRRMFA